MEAPEPARVVRGLFESFDRGDLDGLLATLSPEVRIVYVGANPQPVQAVLVGHERARRFFEGIFRRLEVSRFEPAESPPRSSRRSISPR
jgi:ketosteroid isomerase-like protein